MPTVKKGRALFVPLALLLLFVNSQAAGGRAKRAGRAALRERGARLLYESAVVLLASDHIVSVTPLAAVRHGEAGWAQILAHAPAERHS